MKRITWVDAVRGFGMILVVFGHTWPGLAQQIIYWFHMPLFFTMSGYMYRSTETWRDYALRRGKQLMIPYAFWLLLVSAIQVSTKLESPAHVLSQLLIGGPLLRGMALSFWFLTSLYAAVLIYHAVQIWIPRWQHLFVLVGVGLAVVRAAFFSELYIPFSIDASLVAIVFIHLGVLSRRHAWEDNILVLGLASLPFLAAATAKVMGWIVVPSVDYREAAYGWPAVGLALAASGVALTVLLIKNGSWLHKTLGHVGRVALLTLATHLLVLWIVVQHFSLPAWSGFLLALLLPVGLIKPLRRSLLVRTVALGEVVVPASSY